MSHKLNDPREIALVDPYEELSDDELEIEKGMLNDKR